VSRSLTDRELFAALRAALPVEEVARRLGVDSGRIHALLDKLEGLLGQASPEELVIYVDGAARGNPGPAGAGAALIDTSGKVVAQVSAYLGECTNNVAEYRALELALQKALEIGARAVRVRTDSALMARQLNGDFRVRNGNLVPLYQRVTELVAQFDRFAIEEVPRQANKKADVLANNAIDAALAGQRSGS
jgi:ribonuclease HI